MAVCTFFGHHDCPESIRPALLHAVRELIETQGVDEFYIGDSGRFDALARSVLRELSRELPHIRYAVVLAYLPKPSCPCEDDTMLPEGIEHVHPRYAIEWRNRWMLERAQYVVSYVTHTWGGAAQCCRKAERMGKLLIPLNK